jgi:hypothetical protein
MRNKVSQKDEIKKQEERIKKIKSKIKELEDGSNPLRRMDEESRDAFNSSILKYEDALKVERKILEEMKTFGKSREWSLKKNPSWKNHVKGIYLQQSTLSNLGQKIVAFKRRFV